MSKLSANLTKRREHLGMSVEDVVEELGRRGVLAAYSTVAGWFNGSRGARWKVNELRALLDVLQTDLDAMTEGEVELVEEALPAAIARETRKLTPQQQQAVLAMVKTMGGGT